MKGTAHIIHHGIGPAAVANAITSSALANAGMPMDTGEETFAEHLANVAANSGRLRTRSAHSAQLLQKKRNRRSALLAADAAFSRAFKNRSTTLSSSNKARHSAYATALAVDSPPEAHPTYATFALSSTSSFAGETRGSTGSSRRNLIRDGNQEVVEQLKQTCADSLTGLTVHVAELSLQSKEIECYCPDVNMYSVPL